MQTTIQQTVATAKQTEAALAATLNHVAGQIDGIGVNTLADAVNRLQQSANDCSARFERTRNDASAILSDLAGWLTGFAAEIAAGPVQTAPLALLTAPVSEPTPEPAKEKIASQEAVPSVEEVEHNVRNRVPSPLKVEDFVEEQFDRPTLTDLQVARMICGRDLAEPQIATAALSPVETQPEPVLTPTPKKRTRRSKQS